MLAKAMHREFPDLKITLTDYYPNIRAFERTQAELKDVFEFEKQPVNAMEMPRHLHGQFITLFGAFHHFKPDNARKILQNAVDTADLIQQGAIISSPANRNIVYTLETAFDIIVAHEQRHLEQAREIKHMLQA